MYRNGYTLATALSVPASDVRDRIFKRIRTAPRSASERQQISRAAAPVGECRNSSCLAQRTNNAIESGMEGSQGAAGGGDQGGDDLGAFAVFDPDAGEARARGFRPGQHDNGPSSEFPSLMSVDAVDQMVEARWRKQREPERGKDKPDPWPIIERAFPRIAATILDQWGERALDDYFSKLGVDDRGGRQGFPPEVLLAIMEVARLHGEQHRFSRPLCPWETDVSETQWGFRR